ncbi:MAG: hypothetical protein PHT32_07940 [Candidatus Omnitrophica bacterium]|nr:hypothetical protein [Candidatus Omnitrophota bacterium]
MPIPNIKRKRYLVSRQFQLKYVGMILIFMFCTAALCSYVVYQTSLAGFGERLAGIYPQGRFVSIMKSINLKILLSLMVVTPLVAIIGIFLSHKIAGPLVRIERFVNNMTYGDFSTYLILRKGDELMSLADKINQLIKTMKGNLNDQRNRLKAISGELDGLKSVSGSKPEEQASVIAGLGRVDHQIKDLIKELNKYKV